MECLNVQYVFRVQRLPDRPGVDYVQARLEGALAGLFFRAASLEPTYLILKLSQGGALGRSASQAEERVEEYPSRRLREAVGASEDVRERSVPVLGIHALRRREWVQVELGFPAD